MSDDTMPENSGDVKYTTPQKTSKPRTSPRLSPSKPNPHHPRIPNLQRIEQPHQRPQLLISLASLSHVMHEAWGIGEVFWFAVAVVDARENTENPEVALQANPFDIAIKIVECGGHRQACLPGFFPVADGAVEYLFLVPRNEGVAV